MPVRCLLDNKAPIAFGLEICFPERGDGLIRKIRLVQQIRVRLTLCGLFQFGFRLERGMRASRSCSTTSTFFCFLKSGAVSGHMPRKPLDLPVVDIFAHVTFPI